VVLWVLHRLAVTFALRRIGEPRTRYRAVAEDTENDG
jgi:hypothetical protein